MGLSRLPSILARVTSATAILSLSFLPGASLGSNDVVRPQITLQGVGVGRPPYRVDLDGDGTPDFLFPSAHRTPPKDLAMIMESGGPAGRAVLSLCDRCLACSGKDGHILWEYRAKGTLAPVYNDGRRGRLILATSKGGLIELDTTTGRPTWTWSAPAGTILDWEYSNGTVFVATTSGGLHAIAAEGGSRLWDRDLPLPRSSWTMGAFLFPRAAHSPLIPIRVYGKTLVAATRDGRVVGLDTGTGGQLWSTGVDGVPSLVWGGQDILVAGKRTLTALSAKDGGALWTSDVRSAFTHSRVIADGEKLLCLEREGGELRAVYVDPGTGRTLWRTPIAPAANLSRSLTWGCCAEGGLALGWQGPKVVRLDSERGGAMWSCDAGGNLLGRPLVAGDRIALLLAKKDLVVLDAATGRVIWTRKDAVGAGKAYVEFEDVNDVTVVGQRFWVFKGGVQVLDAADGAVRATIPAGGTFFLVGCDDEFAVLSGHGTCIVRVNSHGDPISAEPPPAPPPPIGTSTVP